MFDIGFWEMAFIGVIALVVIGPERLPEVARGIGVWLGKVRRMLQDVKTDLKSHMSAAELEEFRDFKRQFHDTKDRIQKSVTDAAPISELRNEIEGAASEFRAGLDDGDRIGQEHNVLSEIGLTEKSPTQAGTAKKSPAKRKAISRKKTTKKRTDTVLTRRATAMEKETAVTEPVPQPVEETASSEPVAPVAKEITRKKTAAVRVRAKKTTRKKMASTRITKRVTRKKTAFAARAAKKITRRKTASIAGKAKTPTSRVGESATGASPSNDAATEPQAKDKATI